MNIPTFIDSLLKKSKTDECIIIVQQRLSTNIRWANTTLTTNGQSEQIYLAIYAIQDSRVGSVITSMDEQVDGDDLLRSAEEKAKISEPAFDIMPVLPGNGEWDISAYSHTAKTKQQEKIYKQLSVCFDESNRLALKLFGYEESKYINYWAATSKGLRKFATHQECSVELNLKTTDFKKSVWAGSSGHSIEELNMSELLKTLTQKMEWSKNTIILPAGKYETILEPSAVADLMLYNYWSSAARNADEGNSSYSRSEGKNAIGEQVCSKDISIFSDPSVKSMEVPNFEIAYSTSAEQSIFDTGLELSKTYWIKNGGVESLITPRYWAKEKNIKPSPFIPNLIFDHPKGPSLEDMIASTKRGLLVTCLWYIREVDPQTLLLTGLTRDGVFLIEDGKVVGEVNNFRFNMSPMATLKQTSEIGASQNTLAREFGDYFNFACMPPMRVADFNMSTVSDAV